MAFLATAINYIDRANLAVAMPCVQSELGLSAGASGALLGAFFWTYAGFQLPSGWFVDKVGARIAYAVAVTWWSFSRPSWRSIVSAIIGYFGWRVSFVITGALGFIWTVVWIRLYRRPREHAGVAEAELADIEARQAPLRKNTPNEPKLRWRDLFRYRTVWGMMLGFFCLNFVIYFFITWFPTYLVKERGFTLLKLGIFGTIPALVAIVGGWVGGWASDTLVRRGMSLTAARKNCRGHGDVVQHRAGGHGAERELGARALGAFLWQPDIRWRQRVVATWRRCADAPAGGIGGRGLLAAGRLRLPVHRGRDRAAAAALDGARS